MAFESNKGEILVIGFKNGDVKILNTETLQDIHTFCPSSDAVQFLKFSPSGQYIAGFDAGNHTILFKRYSTTTTVCMISQKSYRAPSYLILSVLYSQDLKAVGHNLPLFIIILTPLSYFI